MLRSVRSGQALGKLYWHWNDTWKNDVLFTLLKHKVTQEGREFCSESNIRNFYYRISQYHTFKIHVTLLNVQDSKKYENNKTLTAY